MGEVLNGRKLNRKCEAQSDSIIRLEKKSAKYLSVCEESTGRL